MRMQDGIEPKPNPCSQVTSLIPILSWHKARPVPVPFLHPVAVMKEQVTKAEIRKKGRGWGGERVSELLKEPFWGRETRGVQLLWMHGGAQDWGCL